MENKGKNYEIHSSTREEMNEGWVWVRNKELEIDLKGRRRIVRISYSNNHPVYCEALYVSDKYDIKWFNGHFGTKTPDGSICKYPYADSSDSSLPINWEKELIFISQWYRQALGIKEQELPVNKELTIEVTKKRCKQILWQFLACLEHPQIMVLLSTVLGILSVGLGIIGFGIGLIAIPICSSGIFPVVRCIGGVIMVFGLGVMVCGFSQLIRRATYAPPSYS